MLHYYGDRLAMSLGSAALEYIFLYKINDKEVCFVPFIDLGMSNKRRYVKFAWLNNQWVFIDITNENI